MVDVVYDLHTHTAYSDGSDWKEMAKAAERAGLRGIGLTDHCPVGDDPFGRREMYDLEETYGDRRSELDSVAGEYDIEIFDGAEVNYDPGREGAIRAFLDEADFAYTIGSVHYAGEYYIVHPDDLLSQVPASEHRSVVDEFVDWQVQLIESDLFDVVGHLDVLQRSPTLRGAMEEADYRRLATALADSEMVPEINAGRLDASYGTVHPDPEYLHLFADEGIPFVVGTDSHAPDQIERRVEALRGESLDVDILELPDALC